MKLVDIIKFVIKNKKYEIINKKKSLEVKSKKLKAFIFVSL